MDPCCWQLYDYSPVVLGWGGCLFLVQIASHEKNGPNLWDCSARVAHMDLIHREKKQLQSTPRWLTGSLASISLSAAEDPQVHWLSLCLIQCWNGILVSFLLLWENVLIKAILGRKDLFYLTVPSSGLSLEGLETVITHQGDWSREMWMSACLLLSSPSQLLYVPECEPREWCCSRWGGPFAPFHHVETNPHRDTHMSAWSLKRKKRSPWRFPFQMIVSGWQM